jgi:hypothetical protein
MIVIIDPIILHFVPLPTLVALSSHTCCIVILHLLHCHLTLVALSSYTCCIVIPHLLHCHPAPVALSSRTCCIVIPRLLHCHPALVALCHPALVAGSGVLNISKYKSFHSEFIFSIAFTLNFFFHFLMIFSQWIAS